MKRTLIVGDIHGGLRALNQVLERANISADDTLVFLGDYVDGWSESAQVVEFLIDFSQKQPCIFIKGNHDVWCEEWLNSDSKNETWLKHGGKETIDSYQNLALGNQKKHHDFLREMPFYHIDQQNRLFIHAGFTSMHGPEHEFHQSNFSWDRTLWEMALTMDKRIQKDSKSYPKRLLLFHEIYIGHTPTLNYGFDTPMQGCNVWNLDTGAAFTGKLTIMDIDSKEFWQSDSVQSLYPNEKGRNKN
jgi:serine/threonine protein phosphatase 1